MKNKLILFFFICLTVFSLTACQEEAVEMAAETGEEQPDAAALIPGLVRVKFKANADLKALEANLARTSGVATRTGISSMDVLGGKYRIKSMKRLFRYSPKFESLHQKHGLQLWYELEVSTEMNTRSVAVDYQKLAEVEYAGPVFRIVSGDDGITIPVEAVPSEAVARAGLPFNDSHLGKQWHYDRGEQQTPLEKANIGLFAAWEVNAGRPEVVVAIVDDGVDYTHEDLAANMWVNEAEKNGLPGEDDDHNGFVDDVYGYNFADDIPVITPSSHGTHVAGTVAAVNNNGKGVCGVAGGSGKGDGARVMSCQILSSGSSSGAPEAMVYAADMGAVISQNSWGYTSPGFTEPSVEAAIKYFIEEAGQPTKHPGSLMRGGLVVFAAGNDGAVSRNYYPAAYDMCVAVTATDHRNERASLTQTDHSNGIYYANVAPWVDLSAPGGTDGQFGVLSTVPENKYGYKSGTSMACPHVSGVAALVVSQMGGADFTCERLKEILYASVLDLGAYETKYSRYMGHGLLRADLALHPKDENPPVAVTDLSVAAVTANSCTLTWSGETDADAGSVVLYRVYYSRSELTPENYASASSKELSVTNPLSDALCTLAVEGLEPERYYFAVVGVNKQDKLSDLSNVVVQWLLPAGDGKVYPTAVKDEVTVALGSAFIGKITVNVFDAGGNRIVERQFEHTPTLKINLSGLSAGVYTLQVKTAGAEMTKRIVKL